MLANLITLNVFEWMKIKLIVFFVGVEFFDQNAGREGFVLVFTCKMLDSALTRFDGRLTPDT